MDLALLSASFHQARTRTWGWARDWGECALGLAFPWPVSDEAVPVPIEPPFCSKCGYPFPALAGHLTEFVCSNCVDKSWHFEWARSGYLTVGQVLQMIVGFKYGDEYFREAQLIDWITAIFDQHAMGEDQKWNALVPVPLYRRRHRWRGFNQALEITRGLSRRRKIPVSDCLYRYTETVSQTKLGREARWKNMAGAFKMKRGFDVSGQNLLIIDDVFTTGATVNACAQALHEAGANRLAVLTIARS